MDTLSHFKSRDVRPDVDHLTNPLIAQQDRIDQGFFSWHKQAQFLVKLFFDKGIVACKEVHLCAMTDAAHDRPGAHFARLKRWIFVLDKRYFARSDKLKFQRHK